MLCDSVQLLDLHDFPGQGTALVGVLDAFWDEKGYVDAEEYSTFCNSTVPLVRFPKMNWLNNERLSAPIEVAHFGAEPLDVVTLRRVHANAHSRPPAAFETSTSFSSEKISTLRGSGSLAMSASTELNTSTPSVKA